MASPELIFIFDIPDKTLGSVVEHSSSESEKPHLSLSMALVTGPNLAASLHATDESPSQSSRDENSLKVELGSLPLSQPML